jgi:HSP20 family molecular chaperone IbpA
LKQNLRRSQPHESIAKRVDNSVWLICQMAFGKGKTKLLVRGIHGAEWVFCPMVRSIKKDKVSVQGCRGCQHFIRFEQTCIPQTPPVRRAILSTKHISSFHFARPSSRLKTKIPNTRPFPHTLSFIREKQPLIDVLEEEDHLLVLAELPGVDEKDVHVQANENTITITAENPTTRYLKMIKLPTRIKKDSVQFTCRNNILQVKLEKMD